MTIDEVLTTTRAVRKRLDVSRPVSRALIDERMVRPIFGIRFSIF